ncbi:MAG: glycosyltransferase [Steroidobacteraceae bacterium]
MIVAGPDEAGYLRKMRDLAVDLGLQNDVHFVGGDSPGPAKASAYRSADIFVLPTASENFGIVIAEALAYGVPVITTRAAPWRALETGGCGWWIEQGVAPLGAALRSAMTLSDDQRKAMGEKGRVVARRAWSGWLRQRWHLHIEMRSLLECGML